MKSTHQLNDLMGHLPQVRGKLTPAAPISRLTWFRVGGKAEVLFEPADQADLQEFLSNLDGKIKVTVIGNASNIIVRDGGIPGITIRLGRSFSDIVVNEATITAYAGAMDIKTSREARNYGIGGLEFLSGIPGSIGGAIRMNAGAYDGQIKDVLVEATAIDRQGNLRRVTPPDLGFTYRNSSAPNDWIFISALLKGRPEQPSKISARMLQILENRNLSQPIKERTGGSTFKNPEGLKAWQLIDSAGCRGLRKGGAQVSTRHCNFLINTGKATATDIENLGLEVHRRVKDETGVDLEWEIKRMGVSTKLGTCP
ncbi:MAG: UDP-N-acetylmuramate dehydrogenase [Pseudomonadota bacterium]|nr:UDP-N-acetylmuramate dehydrogenase [Pseudomonadota bacterium]